MALDRCLARLSKMIVDSDGVTFEEAQARLSALTLEIRVGSDASSQAAHCAILTALTVGRRSFIGGVRVVGLLDQPLMSALPVAARNLSDAVRDLGASEFSEPASCTVVVGGEETGPQEGAIHLWWSGWRAGASPEPSICDAGGSPLAGITAGALGVALAFERFKGGPATNLEVDLWPSSGNEHAPAFSEIWLPDGAWIVGLGNLGQAFLWALSSLPYKDASSVSVVLQDQDRVSEENWATSLLVHDEVYGDLKTRVGEDWVRRKGFDVRRIDRYLTAEDRVREGDPRLALSGTDTRDARRRLASTGFSCIIDAGLGRTAKNYDRLRVTLFDAERQVADHFSRDAFAVQEEPGVNAVAYRKLREDIGQCGMIEIAGSSVAACYVSAIAACTAVSRMIAVTSGYPVPQAEVRQLGTDLLRATPLISVSARALGHAGRPAI